MGCDGLITTIVILKSSFLPEEPERRILRDYCRGIGPKGSLSLFILGLRSKPRIIGRPRMVNVVKGARVSK